MHTQSFNKTELEWFNYIELDFVIHYALVAIQMNLN